MKKNLFLVIAGILLCKVSFAQRDFRPGYVVKVNGDSLHGLVNYHFTRKVFKQCYFKSDRKGNGVVFSPEDIRSYGFNASRRFESLILNTDETNGKKFAEQLVDGKLSLYKYKRFFFIRTDSIKKDSVVFLPHPKQKVMDSPNSKYVTNDKKYVGILNTVLISCNQRADVISYTKSDLVRLVRAYNACRGEIFEKEKKEKIKLNYFLYSGLDISLTEEPISASKTSYAALAGAGVDVSSPVFSNQLFFSLESSFVKRSSHYITESYGVNSDTHTSFNFIRVPFGFRFNILNEKHSPYLRMGFVQYIKLKATIELDETRTSNGVTETTHRSFEDTSGTPKGFWFAAGLSRPVSLHNSVFLELRMEKTAMTQSQQTYKATYGNILLGFRW